MHYGVFVFDLDSAYPSAIVANNICPTTIIEIDESIQHDIDAVKEFLASKGFDNYSVININHAKERSKPHYVAFDKNKKSVFV